MIGDVQQLVFPQAEAKHIKVSGEQDSDIPEYVCGDELRVRQVLLNLAANAVKFTDKGAVTVKAQLKEKSDSRIAVRFSVTDTGVGIPLAQQPRLFQPFEQLHDATKQVRSGTGLGLSISKQLVELMGGTIGVFSEPGPAQPSGLIYRSGAKNERANRPTGGG